MADQSPANLDEFLNSISTAPENMSPAPEPEVAPPAAPNYVTNGNFDFNRFILENPSAPIDSKLGVASQLNAQDQFEAQAQAEKDRATQADAAKIAQYNQMALSRGLPTIGSPATQGTPLADASQNTPMLPSSLKEDSLPPAPPPASPPTTNSNSMGSLTSGIPSSFNLQNNVDLQKKGYQQQYEAGRKKAAEQTGIYDELARQQEASALRERDNQKNHDQFVNDWLAKREQLQKDYEAEKVKDPVADRSTGQKITAGIAVALGALGQAYGQKENLGLQIINQDIERQMQLQRESLDKKRGDLASQDNLIARGMDVFKNKSLAELNAQEALYKRAQTQVAATAARYEGTEQAGKLKVLEGQLGEQAQGKALEFAKTASEIYEKQANAQQITSGANLAKDLKQNQWQAAGFARQIEGAYEKIQNLQANGYDPTSTKYRGQGVLPKELQNKGTQQYNQAEDDIILAILRKESGAAISDSERKEVRRTYLSQPGDSEELKAQKDAALLRKAQAYKAEGGAAYNLIQPISAPVPKGEYSRKELMDVYQTASQRLQQNPNDGSAQKALILVKQKLGI